MATLKQTAFRLDAEDFAILDAVKKQMGFAARSDALRYVLRQYAREHSIDATPPKRKPKR